MSSIMTSCLLPTKKRLSQLYTSLQQRLQSFGDSLSEDITQEPSWLDFQEDIKFLSKMTISYADALEEERLVVCKIEAFIKNLQLTNNQLIEQQKQLMGRIQQTQKSKYDLSIAIQNLINSKNLQFEEVVKRQTQKIEQMKKIYQYEHKRSSQQKIQLKIELENLKQSKKLLQQQLMLKQIEIQLAELSIHDLVNEKKALEDIVTIYSPKKQSCIDYEFSHRKSTEPKSHRRHNSLLDDLVQSQILYDPYLSSQMFKSTQTIQETTEDQPNQSDTIGVDSHIDVRQKRSKAISVNIPSQKHLQYYNFGVQTDRQGGIWAQWHKKMKNVIIERRIKR